MSSEPSLCRHAVRYSDIDHEVLLDLLRTTDPHVDPTDVNACSSHMMDTLFQISHESKRRPTEVNERPLDAWNDTRWRTFIENNDSKTLWTEWRAVRTTFRSAL